jgi:multiple sugar transport system substrate-binding protein
VAPSATTAPAAPTAAPTTAAPSPTPQAQAPAAAKVAGNLGLSYWTDADTPSYTKAIDEFNKTNPNVKVQLNLIADQYQTKLETQIAGAVAPDIARQNTGQFHAFALRNVWVPLDSYFMRDNLSKDNFWPQAIVGASLFGKLYAMPSDLSSWYMYYIKAPFDKAGIPYPDTTWDWVKFKEVAQSFTKNTNNPAQAQWGFHVWNWWDGPTESVLRENGADFWSDKTYTDSSKCVIDSPNAIEAFDWYFGLLTKDHLSPAGAFINSFAGGQFGLYQSGKIAMWLGGSWMAFQVLGRWPSTAPEWGMTLFPHAPNQPQGGQYATDEHALWTGGKNLDTSWEFLKFLGSEAANRILDLDVGRSIPAVKSVTQDSQFLQWHGKDMKVALDALAVAWSNSDDCPYAFEVNQIMNPYMDEMYAGTKDAKTDLPAVARDVTKMLMDKRGH